MVGTVCSEGMRASSHREMCQKVLGILKEITESLPDIICLPECFAFSGVSRPVEVAGIESRELDEIVDMFARFAKERGCYLICSSYLREGAQVYVAATLIDRQGLVVGEYRKARPSIGEMERGVSPGPIEAPVFETDFGKVGIQICYDLKWDDGWESLARKGAEIVFWPSAYAGGREIASRAWRHQYPIVTSSLKDRSRVIGCTGETLPETGRWQGSWVCSSLNLEVAFLHAWPAAKRFAEVQHIYGRRIRLTSYEEEEWAVLESLDPELKIAEILDEFGLLSHAEQISVSQGRQDKERS